MTCIRAKELTKRYRAVAALDGISFEIAGGGPVALVGKNGAGKTTLLAVLCGILSPSSGFVEILGLPHVHPGLLGKIGVLMQDASFRYGISGIDQLIHLAQLAGAPRNAAMSVANGLLRELGDEDFVRLKPEAMSYGQRKRLGIVQALLGEPRLVLLDEPTAGLDPMAAHAVRQLIRRRSTDTLFMISSHNLYEVQDICQRVLVIDRGRLINDVDISKLVSDSNRLSVTLNRKPAEDLVSSLLQIAEVTGVARHPGAPEKLFIDLATTEIDRIQIQIQASINTQGYSVMNLTRGRTLEDGVLELVETLK